MRIEVLNYQDLAEKKYGLHPRTYLVDHRYYDEIGAKKDDDWTPEAISDYRSKILTIKKSSPELYRCKRANFAIGMLTEKCPSLSDLGLTEAEVSELYSKETVNFMKTSGNTASLVLADESSRYPRDFCV